MLKNTIKKIFSIMMAALIKRRLRFDLLSSFFMMQILTVVSISTFMYNTHTSSLLSTSELLIKSDAHAKMQTIVNRLSAVGHVLRSANHLVTDEKDVDVTNKTLLTFMTQYAKRFEYMDSIFFALKNGRFFQIKKIFPKTAFKTLPGKLVPKNAKWALRLLQWSEKNKSEIWYYIDGDFRLLDQESIPESEITLNFFTREWYKNAFEQETMSWSSIYVLSTTHLPGVAASYPLHDKNGNIIGAIGSDLHLKNMKDILKDVSFAGTAMIINDAGEIVVQTLKDETPYNAVSGMEFKLAGLDTLPQKHYYDAYQEKKKTNKDLIFIHNPGVDYIVNITKFADEYFSSWYLMLSAPVDVFIGTVKAAQLKVLYISLAILLLSTAIISYMTLRISKPIHSLVKQAERIRVFDLSAVPLVQSSIVEIQKLQDAISRMRRNLEAFGKFVPKNLVRSLVEKDTDLKIGGRKRRVSLIFTDIEGFTSISESSSADKLMLHLSEYFDEMSKIIIKEHGTIDKYIGDAIMSFWGAPNVDAKHALHACQAALFCQKRLIDLNRKWVYDKKPSFNTRIGIHTGEVIVGNLGSSERMNYTVIGDAVNLASRLEGINKNYGTKIIISESVYKEIIDHAIIRPLDIVAVKGKREGIPIYELIALTGSDPYLLPTQDELDLCHMFQKAFKHYYEQRWDDAIDIFEKIILRFPGDMPTQMYINRCKHFKENSPGKDWDHIHHMKEK